MKEVSLEHAALIMWPFHQDVAEHYQYYDQLFSLDLNDARQAQRAIENWLLPQVADWSDTGRALRMEACRVCISQNVAFSGYWLPGIEDRWKASGDMEEYRSDLAVFQKLAWRLIFGEVYVPAMLSDYVRRVDEGFESFPDFPEKWGGPCYADWPASFVRAIDRRELPRPE